MQAKLKRRPEPQAESDVRGLASGNHTPVKRCTTSQPGKPYWISEPAISRKKSPSKSFRLSQTVERETEEAEGAYVLEEGCRNSGTRRIFGSLCDGVPEPCCAPGCNRRNVSGLRCCRIEHQEEQRVWFVVGCSSAGKDVHTESRDKDKWPWSNRILRRCQLVSASDRV
eukprot:2577450-Rhodomonas_salina.1